MHLQEMLRTRAEALTAADVVLARAEKAGRAPTETETALIDEHMAVAKKLNPQIERIESQNGLRQYDPVAMLSGRLVKPGEPDPADARPKKGQTTLQEALKHASTQEVEQVKAFARYIGGDMTALADLTPGGDGGVFIPTMVAGVVERNYAAFTPVVNNCRVWPTADGEPTKFPVITDSEDAEILAPAALTGADATVSGDTPPTELGGPTMGAHKFSSKPVFIPRETIVDSTLSVLDEILSALLARIYRTQNLKYTKGTGTGEPEGFLKNATAYSAGAVALDLTLRSILLTRSPPCIARMGFTWRATPRSSISAS